MNSRIEIIPAKKLIGMHCTVTLSNHMVKTPLLWQSFMPHRKKILKRADELYYSMKVYNEGIDYSNFNPNAEFEKWAAVEVQDFNQTIDGLETYTMIGGKYAVFIHKGVASTFPATMQYIFGTWLPSSEFELDHREHFEILNEGYDLNDPNWEEEIWIPIK